MLIDLHPIAWTLHSTCFYDQMGYCGRIMIGEDRCNLSDHFRHAQNPRCMEVGLNGDRDRLVHLLIYKFASCKDEFPPPLCWSCSQYSTTLTCKSGATVTAAR